MAGGDPAGVPGPCVLDVEHRGHPLSVAYLHRPGEGEALLYFHGLGCSKEDFIGAWSVPGWRDHTLVAFDAPGCGATRGHRPGLPLGVDDVVEVAAALT
ncbi:MAG TPA: alpha/beta hydrolase, partial [Longimicrobiales bacterium]|nr:alpha/beta hydrolase [Longimicrobiales bacterium]